MRFLLDENLPRRLADLLTEQGHDVLDVARSPNRGAPDETIWRLAADEDRMLLTRDLGFAYPGTRPAPPAVILVRVPSELLAASVAALVTEALKATPEDELGGRVTVISPGRIRSRRLPS